MNQELQNYINEERKQGTTDEVIKQKLRANGWQDDMFKDYFFTDTSSQQQPYLQEHSSKTKNHNTLILIVLGAMIVLAMGAYFAYAKGYFNFITNDTQEEVIIVEEKNNDDSMVVKEDLDEEDTNTIEAGSEEGIYNSNIDKYAMTEDDLPDSYGPYEKNINKEYNLGEAKNYTVDDPLFGFIKSYRPEQIRSVSNSSTGFTLTQELDIFEDIATAERWYSYRVNISSIVFDEDGGDTKGVFDGIGDANYYQTSDQINEYNSDYNSTHWDIYIINSNMFIRLIIVTPTSYSVAEMQELLFNWQNKQVEESSDWGYDDFNPTTPIKLGNPDNTEDYSNTKIEGTNLIRFESDEFGFSLEYPDTWDTHHLGSGIAQLFTFESENKSEYVYIFPGGEFDFGIPPNHKSENAILDNKEVNREMYWSDDQKMMYCYYQFTTAPTDNWIVPNSEGKYGNRIHTPCEESDTVKEILNTFKFID